MQVFHHIDAEKMGATCIRDATYIKEFMVVSEC